ncbi:MAG: TetR/AcrR family transcriptional regulator [Pseudomonadota bacterium]
MSDHSFTIFNMGRPKVISEEAVITAAQNLFWKQGYCDTGMAQVLSESATKPGSFYSVFENKRALLVRVIEHHVNTVVQSRIAHFLNTPTDPMEGIRDFLLSSSLSFEDGRFVGCLLVKSSAEFAGKDSEIENQINRGLATIRDALCSRLDEAKALGQIPESLDSLATASLLQSIDQGIGLNGELARDQAQLERTIHQFLDLLEK